MIYSHILTWLNIWLIYSNSYLDDLLLNYLTPYDSFPDSILHVYKDLYSEETSLKLILL
jgi:hypothetical protein